MPKNQHQLSNIDSKSKTATCSKCGFVSIYHQHNVFVKDKSYWFCINIQRENKRGPDKSPRGSRGPSHTLTEIDENNRVAKCSICGPTDIHYTTCHTTGRFYWFCKTRARKNKKTTKQRDRARKQEARGMICEKCGFKAEIPWQIESHHPFGRDGDYINVTVSLCGNCHRLETWKEKHASCRYIDGDWVSTHKGDVNLTSDVRNQPEKHHKLTNKNIENMTADCSICGPVKLRYKKNIRRYYCANKYAEYGLRAGRRYIQRLQKAKGDVCCKCNFKAENPCQLDWNHINGDHSDDRSENKEPVCVNCHRLISYQNNHHLNFTKQPDFKWQDATV